MGELNVVTVECVSIVFKTLERLFTKYDTSPLPPQSMPLYNPVIVNTVTKLIKPRVNIYTFFTCSVLRALQRTREPSARDF